MNDFKIVETVLTKFLSFYNQNYREMRHGATDHLSEAVKCVRDLNFDMMNSPSSFSVLHDAQWTYTRMLASLNKCASSAGLVVQYLTLAVKNESIIQQQYKPSRFTFEGNISLCTEKFSVIFETFENIFVFFTYAIHRLNQWQRDNEENILFSSTKILANSQSKNSSLNYNNSWPGIWQLFNLGEQFNKSTWVTLTKPLKNSLVVDVTNCLLTYEHVLESVLNFSNPSIKGLPMLFPNTSVGELLHSLDLQNFAIDTLIRSYLKGNINSLDTASKTSNLLKDVSNNLSLLNDEWTKMKIFWFSNIGDWCDDVKAAYSSLISQLIILSKFIDASTELSMSVSNMQINYRPFIIITPDIIIKFKAPNNERAAENIADIWVSYLTESATSTVRDTLSNIENSIKARGQELASITASLYNDWKSLKLLINVETDDYINSFSLDDHFVS